ncbi:hypothetical protein RhiirA1_542227 [Rhizophagus irregularis]|uniref:Uncharacterized protein n=1 Tax=Rhizophagus irregularis TaxID=588596 RepID=A0A2N0QYK9_9GLOM|nr:hypothetical protein RhiirA1_542227 [Rhizophagus irregularis]
MGQSKKEILEKNFYSKVFVARSVRFAIDKASNRDTELSSPNKFIGKLATILAREREVVALSLKILPNNKCKIYIAKNDEWLPKDREYINKVKKVLINVSKEAPMTFAEAHERDDVKKLAITIFEYCKHKVIFRLNKLRKDIAKDEIYIRSFLDYAKSDGVDDVMHSEIHVISRVCYNYYPTAKKDPTIPEKFLRHIKKVGSYIGSFIYIIDCACKPEYKTQFSCIELKLLDPNTAVKTVSSWSDTVKHYFRNQTNNVFYEFKERCLNDPVIKEDLVRVYGKNGKETPGMLDCEVTKKLRLHAEMNVLLKLMDHGKKDIGYIAVSKKCCYLCDLYINFLKSKGYNITISGSHKKLYHFWELPDALKQEFINYATSELDYIIEQETNNHTNIIAISDSDPDSDDSDPDRKHGFAASYCDDLVIDYIN